MVIKTQSLADMIAKMVVVNRNEVPVKEIKVPDTKKLNTESLTRISVILALKRVVSFCELHLSLPGTNFDTAMLERGRVIALSSLNYFQADEELEDLPINLFLPDYYRHIILNLADIKVETISDFLSHWQMATERAKLRRAWSISVGGKKHPIFLEALLPRNRKEMYGNN